MKRTNIHQAIQEIFSLHFGVDDPSIIQPATSLQDDLMLDSMDVVELIMHMEKRFDFPITDIEAEKALYGGGTIDDLVDLVVSKLPDSTDDLHVFKVTFADETEREYSATSVANALILASADQIKSGKSKTIQSVHKRSKEASYNWLPVLVDDAFELTY